VQRDQFVLKAKDAYVAAARGSGKVLTRIGFLGDQPPARRRRVRHWAYSLTRVHDSAAMVELDVPWWTYRAIDAVEAWLAVRPRPIRIFEYGSGASSVWLANRADEVHSVEHHAGFAEHMRPILEKAGVDLIVVEPTTTTRPSVPSRKEGHGGLDFSAYVASIETVGGLFDLIVIDGRAREACLIAAIPHLKADGLIVFDNTGRRRYREAIRASGLPERQMRGLTPTLPYRDRTSLLTLR
jgi:Methyltransferase domain